MPQISGPVPLVPAANANAPAPAGPVAISIDARGAQGNSEVQASIARGVSQGLSQYDSHLKRNIGGYVVDHRRRFG